jgi:hypothetical protein
VPKKDLDFIQNFKFEKIREGKKNIKLIQYGYKIEGETVVFRFELPKSINPSEVKFVTVAGSFNGWNPEDKTYAMTLLKKNIYEYRLPKSNLKNEKYEFKFVINGENWQTIPDNAKNTEHGNLLLDLLGK